MSVLQARLRQANAGGSIRKRASAQMTKRNERESTNEMSEAKRRQTQSVLCRGAGHGRAAQRGGAHLSAFHHGSRPKESLIARDSASGQASWDVANSDLSFERALPPPPVPVQRAARAPVLVPRG